MDKIDRALWGRIGAYEMHSRHDAHKTTKAAREAFLARFGREIDPEGILEPEERQARAEAARKAYMLRLSMRSAEVRRQRARRPRS